MAFYYLLFILVLLILHVLDLQHHGMILEAIRFIIILQLLMDLLVDMYLTLMVQCLKLVQL